MDMFVVWGNKLLVKVILKKIRHLRTLHDSVHEALGHIPLLSSSL